METRKKLALPFIFFINNSGSGKCSRISLKITASYVSVILKSSRDIFSFRNDSRIILSVNCFLRNIKSVDFAHFIFNGIKTSVSDPTKILLNFSFLFQILLTHNQCFRSFQTKQYPPISLKSCRATNNTLRQNCSP